MPRNKATPRVREAQSGGHTTYLSERDWEILMDLLDNPPPPNEALIQALRHHRDFVRSFDHADEDRSSAPLLRVSASPREANRMPARAETPGKHGKRGATT
jgi:hypothetical protein